MSDWRVYILRCGDGSLYTGIAVDLPRRLAAHAAGRGSRYVASRRPFRLAYSEGARSRSAALRREAQIKAMTRPQKLGLVAGRIHPRRAGRREPGAAMR